VDYIQNVFSLYLIYIKQILNTYNVFKWYIMHVFAQIMDIFEFYLLLFYMVCFKIYHVILTYD
jgi:hypothetical protein